MPETPDQGVRIPTVWGELTFTPVEEDAALRMAEVRARAEAHAEVRRRCASGRARADRAAQFMPFAALRGYYELVQQQQRVTEPRHELTEEEARELSQVMAGVRRGVMVRITYYDQDAYVTLSGCVARVEPDLRRLTVIKTTISFDDIRNLELLPD